MSEDITRFGYWKGEIVPATEIAISPYDIGLLRGYGVFDVLRTEGRVPFLWEKHWERLLRSAETLGLSVPIQKEMYYEALIRLSEKLGEDRAVIRTVVTGGVSDDGFSPAKTPTFFMLIEPFPILPPEYFERGISVVTVQYARSYPVAKTTNYVEAIRHAKMRVEKGAFEICYVSDGTVLEGSMSNVGMVQGGKLVFPKDGILLGITREEAIDIAREAGMTVEERAVSIEEFLAADEVFLTATNKYVLPVISVDGKQIGAGVPGVVTRDLLHRMQERIHEFRRKNLA